MPEKTPLPNFHFTVEWGGTRIGFSEVSGLAIENQAIEYREGSNPEYTPIKMPGIQKYGNITMKRGIMPADNEFFHWINTIKLHTVEKRDVVIKLLNEDHEPVVIWRVRNAWPVKLEGPELRAKGNEVAIETLEICHEGLTILNE